MWHIANSNPRPREGSDRRAMGKSRASKQFQSTLPRGERRKSAPESTDRGYFNPRSREGSDRPGHWCAPVPSDFNPRPPRGERHFVCIFQQLSILFQSTPPARGATYAADRLKRRLVHFNPRSREGSDCVLPVSWIHHAISIHAPARGATFSSWRFAYSSKFQSTLPRGERQI